MYYHSFIDIKSNKHLIPSDEEFTKVNNILNKYHIGDVCCEPDDMFNCGLTLEGKIIIYDYGDIK